MKNIDCSCLPCCVKNKVPTPSNEVCLKTKSVLKINDAKNSLICSDVVKQL